MGDENGVSASKIEMDIGDAVLYRGTEKYHWRNKFKGKWQAQVFLHYVDANGPYAEWIWDKRKEDRTASAEMLSWSFSDIFTTEDCDLIVKAYSDELTKKEPPLIGNSFGTIDLNVRNVQRVIIPIYKELGAQLVAAGLSANNQSWKFDITHSNQAEFLIYPAGGHYVAHVDTFMAHSEECRKLTVLAFLNDDFKGGKFYIQNGHNKYYPPQSKGTVLVFPSFFLHGVEPVEEGTRYSAVCWMVGKFFK
jgi:PKHD-type hydroxylase